MALLTQANRHTDGACGRIAGVTLTETSYGWGSHVIEFFALGIAIVRTGERTTIEPPVQVLDLNDT